MENARIYGWQLTALPSLIIRHIRLNFH